MFKQNAVKQVVLDEVDYSEHDEPGEDEIREYATADLGINLEEEPELLWIARAGINAPLPDGWKPVEMADGRMYFYNFETNASSWEHPCDEKYRKMVIEERRKLQSRGAFGGGSTKKQRMSHNPAPIQSSAASKSPTPLKRPASAGKLAPIGSASSSNLPSAGAKLAPIGTGKSTPAARPKTATGNPPGRNVQKRPETGVLRELAPVSLKREGHISTRDLNPQPKPEPAVEPTPQTFDRPKTSRGATDRGRSRGHHEKEVAPKPSEIREEEKAAPRLKGGGTRFLKQAPAKQPSEEKHKIFKEGSVEIMTITPDTPDVKTSKFNYDAADLSESTEEESSQDEQASLKSSMNIGGNVIVLDASELESPKKEVISPQPKEEPSAKDLTPLSSTRLSHENLLRRDAQKPAILSVLSQEEIPLDASTGSSSFVKPLQKQLSQINEDRLMESKLKEMKAKFKAEKEREEANIAAELEEYRISLKQKMEADIIVEKEERRKEIEQEMESEQTKIAKIRENLEKDLDALKIDVNETKKSLEEEKRLLLENQKQELENLENDQNLKKQKLKDEGLNRDNDKELRKIKEKFESEKASLERMYEEELSDLKADYETLIAKKASELKKRASESEAMKESFDLSRIKEDFASLKAQLAQLSEVTTNLKEQFSDLLEETKENLRTIQDQQSVVRNAANIAVVQAPVSQSIDVGTQSSPRTQNVEQPNKKQQSSIKSVENHERSIESPESSQDEHSITEESIITKTKNFLAKNHTSAQPMTSGQIMDSGYDLSINEAISAGETPMDSSINECLNRLQMDLRSLSAKIGHVSRSQPTNYNESTRRGFLLYSNPQFADAVIRDRWNTFSRTGQYPTTRHFGELNSLNTTQLIASTHSSQHNSSKTQLDQLKSWLKEFERKVDKQNE